MRKQLFTLSFLAALLSLSAWGQGVKPLPSLHVEGRWLTDVHGNHVVLHGVMDTPSAWFNGGRWGWSYDDAGRQRCLDYFDKLFAGLEKAHCTVFRLHLEPAWTNDPSSSYTYAGAAGQAANATGEADIRKFNPTRLTTYLGSLYFPLMRRAMNHGMYVVVRPPGVCPHDLQVGDYYQQYLLTVWDIVSRHINVKRFAGQISLELANEPVNVRNAQGQDDARALHDYFQPIVDKIRQNGFTGIIWVPGSGWQSNYKSYAAYPIEGANIGYAVHDYAGWYGCSDATPDAQQKISHFHQNVPVVDSAPVIITEVDWSPAKPGTGHYNEHNEWVESNYGTWATASTSKWGKAFKATLDHFGNISMTLSGTSCLIDVDTLLQKNRVVPAFGGLAEACGKACMDWYADYYLVDWPHADDEVQSEEAQTAELLTPVTTEVLVGGSGTLQLLATYADGRQRDVTAQARFTMAATDAVSLDGAVVRGLAEGTATVTAAYTDPLGHELTTDFTLRSTFFPFGKQYINTALFDSGLYDEATRTFTPGQWGQMGWVYADPADMSGYKYLVVKLKKAQNCDAHLNIFTENSIWSDGYESAAFGTKRQIVVKLQSARTKNGRALDASHISIVSFWANGRGSIVVDDMYLTNNDDYSPSAVMLPVTSAAPAADRTYDLQGRPVDARHLKPGLYIRGGHIVSKQ